MWPSECGPAALQVYFSPIELMWADSLMRLTHI
jgi:hypothetical protein